MKFLQHVTAAKREILAADTLVKAKDLWNKADAVRQLGQAANDTELVTYATEFKLRCERRLGELLGLMKARGEIVEGQPKRTVGPPRQYLKDVSISRDLSARAQRIAAVPEAHFERVLADAKAGEQELTRVAVDKLLKLGDAHVRHNAGESEWYTPEAIIHAARSVLGTIDCDPATHPAAQRMIQATTAYTMKEDGLHHPWQGTVWLNPPYAQPAIEQFCQKFTDEFHAGHLTAGIVLTNNATETAWGQRLLKVCHAACFPASRVNFWAPGKTSQPLQGQMMCYVGDAIPQFVRVFAPFGVVLRYAR